MMQQNCRTNERDFSLFTVLILSIETALGALG